MNSKENNNLLVSVCITSYKRVRELKRCLDSIDSRFPSKFEIVISEDNSPLSSEIKKMVLNYVKSSEYNIRFNTNTKNLGYDRNLKKLINLAKGKYIIFMSDDDMFINNSLDKIFNFLEIHNKDFVFSPFVFQDGLFKRKYNNDIEIKKGNNSAAKYLYDAILFSGLIFKRKLISKISAERFVNTNYFQIYLSLFMLYNYGGYYLDIQLVKCIGDGENAYGNTELSQKNHLLANRDSIYSNLEFHKGLIKAIKIFDNDFDTKIFDKFQKEYSLRIYTGLSSARRIGINAFEKYWEKANSLDIELNWIAKLYYYSLKFLGNQISNLLFYLPKRFLIILRRYMRG